MNTTTASTEQQFADFVTKHQRNAERYVTAKVGPHAAPDIVQEALVSTWQKWDTLQDRDRVGYLYGACRNGIFKEYEARNRTVLLAEIPEEAFDDYDYGLAEYDENAEALVMSLYNRKAISDPTVVVAREIAAGYDKQQIAENMNTSVTEVNRCVRELRRGFSAAALQHKIQASVPVYTLQHSSVLTALTTALTRRERQVMALSTLGLKPSAIATLLGISHGSARTTLSHARTKLAEEFTAPGVVVADVNASVRKAMSDTELLGLLPQSPWRTDALFLADEHSAMVKAASFSSNRRVRAVVISGVTPYLKQMAIVLAEVRNALDDSLAIASQIGSIQRQELATGPIGQMYVVLDRNGQLMLPLPGSRQNISDLPGTSPYRCPPPSWCPNASRHPTVAWFQAPDSRPFKAPKSDLLTQHPRTLVRWLLNIAAKRRDENLHLFAGLSDISLRPMSKHSRRVTQRREQTP